MKSWNEIRKSATAFSKRWKMAYDEKSQAQSFLMEFSNFIREKTAPDGSDLAIRIAELFQVLNTPPEKRLATRDEAVAAFPYVNGNLRTSLARART